MEQEEEVERLVSTTPNEFSQWAGPGRRAAYLKERLAYWDECPMRVPEQVLKILCAPRLKIIDFEACHGSRPHMSF
jgi:hypothetical protein